jgi:hypothetical protein
MSLPTASVGCRWLSREVRLRMVRILSCEKFLPIIMFTLQPIYNAATSTRIMLQRGKVKNGSRCVLNLVEQPRSKSIAAQSKYWLPAPNNIYVQPYVNEGI